MRDLLDYLLANVKLSVTPKALKFQVAFLAALTVATEAAADQVLDGGELLAVGAALVGAFGVFWLPNQE